VAKIDEEEYVQSFRTEMMDVAYEWCKGASFADICKMTTVFEGSVIRCMRRLEELLRQMGQVRTCAVLRAELTRCCSHGQASKAIGNTELEAKFADGISKIKRDIIFAASLYL
jgi:ATP-dependent RNA helicase DOB1